MTDDARQIIAQMNQMGTAAATAQATSLRAEDVRIRHGVLRGTTFSGGATTTITLVGVRNPVMLNFDCMFEAATGVWVGKEYQITAAGTDTYGVVWRDSTAAANKNTFTLTVSASLRNVKYVIFFTYVERI